MGRIWILLAAAAAITLAACTTQNPAPDPETTIALGYGALDDAERRGEEDATSQLFQPLPWPTPTALRLGSGAPGPDYWNQRVDYRIDATLDPETDTVSATQRVTYRNNSPHELTFLWMQLEQNLFKPGSIGERAGTSRPGAGRRFLTPREHAEFQGGYTLGRFYEPQNPQSDLPVFVRDTLARVDLPRPIKPGESFVYEFDFSFPVQIMGTRHGVDVVEQGKIFELSQWFPHVCTYDDVHGWNTLPYLGPGEFYTDFGNYQVSITAPRTYTVQATGILQNPSEVLNPTLRQRLDVAATSDEPVWIIRPEEVGTETVRVAGNPDGTLTWRFAAEDVRTFAWAASDAFLWDACRALVSDSRTAPTPVMCHSLYPKEAEAWYPTRERPESRPGGTDLSKSPPLWGSTRAIKHALEFYSEFLDFAYPYPQMSNINGLEGGMEYPMMMFCGARTNDIGLFGVTDHEVAHTWFPMLVNTDERRHVWMDEGFNTYMNAYCRAAWYNQPPDFTRSITQTLQDALDENRQPIVTPPDRYWPGWRGRLGYRKPGYGLTLLREVIVGPEVFDKAFQEYTRRWAYKSPQPADFFRSIEDSAGMDLGYFWRGFFYGTGSIDLAVRGVQTADANLVDGRFDPLPRNQSRFSAIEFETVGDVVLPIPFRVTFDNGDEMDMRVPVEAFAFTNKYAMLVRTDGKTITRVEIDTARVIADVDDSNNTWTR